MTEEHFLSVLTRSMGKGSVLDAALAGIADAALHLRVGRSQELRRLASAFAEFGGSRASPPMPARR
jgi:hypothetical protein